MTTHLNQNGTEEEKFVDELQPGTPLLHGQYVIEAYLNSGGFGITYLAKDSLHRRVVIKECFPSAFCRRANTTVGVRSRAHASEFKSIVKLFVQEARNLARLRHPNIVGVHQVFEDNDTAYMALDFVQGQDLLDIIQDPKIDMQPADVEAMLLKLLHAVKFIHLEGVLHRDISPDNILVTPENEPVLIDFGAARETASKASRILTAMRVVKDGYSPQEFYLSGSDQYPCSDLYALAASIYHLITGTMPPNAQIRLAAVAGNDPDPYIPAAARARGYNRTFLSALDKALNIFPRDRLQTASEWIELIETAPQAAKPEKLIKLAVDNKVEANVQSLMEAEGPDPAQEQAIDETINRLVERRPAPKDAEPKVEAPKRPVRAAPRRPVVDASQPKRISARPALPAVPTVDVEEPPAISLEEARKEKQKSRALLQRTLAALLVTIAVIWFQYGSWNERSPVGPGVITLGETLDLAPITDFSNGTTGATAEGQGPSRIGPRPLPRPKIAPPALPARTGTAEPGLKSQPEFAAAAVASSSARIDLPFAASVTAPLTIIGAERDAPAWMQIGQQILTVNGVSVTSLPEIERAIAPAGDLRPGETAEVIFGLRTADGAQTFVRTLSLPVIEVTDFATGPSVQGKRAGDRWTLTVVTPGGALQAGDVIASIEGQDTALTGPGSLLRGIGQHINAGNSEITFVVQRGSETGSVTVPLNQINN